MSKKVKTAVTPTRQENYPEWYQQVIKVSELAEASPVRGCMVIKPWGYSLWENMVKVLDGMFKETGVKNAYFPLFIPLEFMEKEAEHVEGFAKECAVVTHHRLEDDGNGGLRPSGELAEPLIVRPTSETIIGAQFAKWVSSYRDLPLLINQWSNVVRWEMRTRIFLRTSEFLWQEGHTVHATSKGAFERTELMLEKYREFVETYLAIPVICGKKSDSERFPGAVETLCIEAMMQDRKALQTGTSHFLGQNFSKASGIKFQNSEGEEEFGWTTSWGSSTRMIGGIIMVHGDDDGIVLPPRVASAHIAVIPVFPKNCDMDSIIDFCEEITDRLEKIKYFGEKLRIEKDYRDVAGKNWDWIKKGVPLRIEVGPRDIEKGCVMVSRRDLGAKEKKAYSIDDIENKIPEILDSIHNNMFDKAKGFLEENTKNIFDKESFISFFSDWNKDNPQIHGGFAVSPWCNNPECEEKIQEELRVTIRCIPFGSCAGENEKCVYCGKKAVEKAVFARAY
ncbi:MAG: proline--tRNA ligase [Deltaproteobacteria bacterium]|nr:MAG: proline--tRNA ligase [Deltaproteobacteria bacterium]